MGAGFTNSTGGAITSLDVAYTGEQWRVGATARADRLDFQYSTDATAVSNGTWTDVNALDFSSPNTAAVGATDGNAAANRAALTSTIDGLALAPGATVWIRWSDFNVSGSDDGLAVDDFSLTPHGSVAADAAPAVVGTTPANDATGVPVGEDLTVSFSEPVDLAGNAFRLFCDGTAVPVTVSGGDSSYTLDPSADFADGASCSLTVEADGVTDVDADDPPDNMTADKTVFFYAGDLCNGRYTPAYTIQGSGATAAVTGSTTTRGVVVGDYEAGGLDGFYLQDVDGDGDAATSDAVFVFSPGRNDVSVGDVVWAAGNAGEFQGQTQVSRLPGCRWLPAGPARSTRPTSRCRSPRRTSPSATRGCWSGCRRPSRSPSTSTSIGSTRSGSRSAADSRRPTNVVEPGPRCRRAPDGGALKQIIDDDGLNTQNPDPILDGRGGQRLSASDAAQGGHRDRDGRRPGLHLGRQHRQRQPWRLRAICFDALNRRSRTSTGQPEARLGTDPRRRRQGPGGGDQPPQLLHHLDTRATTAAAASPARSWTAGARTRPRTARQTDKTVTTLTGSGADVVGMAEIENDGYGPANALEYLVDQLNASAGAGTYAFINPDAQRDQSDALGGDAIAVGFIYKPSKVSVAMNTTIERLDDTDVAAFNPALLQQSTIGHLFNGANTSRAASVNLQRDRHRRGLHRNHQPLQVEERHRDRRGCRPGRRPGRLAAAARIAATALAQWVSMRPTGTQDPDVMVVGDLNAYGEEDPIDTLEAAGFTDLPSDCPHARSRTPTSSTGLRGARPRAGQRRA